MASPQKEHGFTPIANEILEAIWRFRFNATQLKVLIYIFRNTYGYHRKEVEIQSFRKLARDMKTEHSGIAKAFKWMIDHNIIQRISPFTYRLNKNYEKWDEMGGVGVDHNPQGVDQIPQGGVENNPHSVENNPHRINKVVIKDNLKDIYIYREDEFITFWNAYPKRINKPGARKAWKSQKANLEEVLKGLKEWIDCDQWTRDGKKYIPHPATFLNRRQWEDEVEFNEQEQETRDWRETIIKKKS